METIHVSFEYGQGLMGVELPKDRTDVFIPGETVPDPDFIPFDKIKEETRKSILNPMGMDPISKLVKEGSKVVIIFPDRVKGGQHASAHRKVSIPIIIDECKKGRCKRVRYSSYMQ